MVISIFSNYQQQQISVYAQQMVKILRRSDGGKSIKCRLKMLGIALKKLYRITLTEVYSELLETVINIKTESTENKKYNNESTMVHTAFLLIFTIVDKL